MSYSVSSGHTIMLLTPNRKTVFDLFVDVYYVLQNIKCILMMGCQKIQFSLIRLVVASLCQLIPQLLQALFNCLLICSTCK